MDEITIQLRNELINDWISYTPEEWAEVFLLRLEDSMVEHRDFGAGGTFQFTGTPEAGRITITRPDGAVVQDLTWSTVTTPSIEELWASQESASNF